MAPNSVEEVFKLIDEIPEANICPTEPELLYRLSRCAGERGEIVEIGTNVGKSTIALAFGQKEKQGRPIHTVDIYEHPSLHKNLDKAGVAQYVHSIVRSSVAAGAAWDKPIELLFIDGDHCRAGAALDIRYWSKRVVEGGRLALHDYPGHLGSNEIAKAVGRHLLAHPRQWRVIHDREFGTILVLERIGSRRPSPTLLRRISEFLYWQHRNIRAYIFSFLPGLSERLVGRVQRWKKKDLYAEKNARRGRHDQPRER